MNHSDVLVKFGGKTERKRKGGCLGHEKSDKKGMYSRGMIICASFVKRCAC